MGIFIMRMNIPSGKRMGLSQMFNKIKVKGGIYHEQYGNYHSNSRVIPIVRRRRLLVE